MSDQRALAREFAAMLRSFGDVDLGTVDVLDGLACAGLRLERDDTEEPATAYAESIRAGRTLDG